MRLAVHRGDDDSVGPGHAAELCEPRVLVVGREVREDADHDHEVEGSVLERERRKPWVDAHVGARHVLGEPADRFLVDVGRSQPGFRGSLAQDSSEPAAPAAEVVDVVELLELVA